ncbi:HET-domain-containing protein [Aulographum hederae CBS 113979]|uniref:HET-domain-containing protein n=1 Tax=Aulographum hederae CBS 113979 TaxID=1176131 RepID=A0A6G1GUF9_9PEZI|nr:HET-domain-containing protein [Aulographum hederae CBS 113979]
MPIHGDGSTIDFPPIRLWLSQCENLHPPDEEANVPAALEQKGDVGVGRDVHFAKVQHVTKLGKHVDLTLIDVFSERLVEKTSEMRYVALSYVWGKNVVLQSRMENFAQLREPGALDSTSGVARVVLDAMEVVRQLGERYLWVDALCIIQDDAGNKHTNISQMDKVYSQCVFTIVAAACQNSDSPLPGVHPGSRGPQISEPAHNLRLLKDPPSLADVLSTSTYDTRAWTLQERLLSPRCFFFTPDQLVLQCAWQRYSELYSSSAPRLLDGGIDYRFSGHSITLLKFPKYTRPLEQVRIPFELKHKAEAEPSAFQFNPSSGFVFYRDLAGMYSARRLSFETDAFNAFAGIMRMLESQWVTASAWALPVDIFHMALLWTPRMRIGHRGGETTAAGGSRDENIGKEGNGTEKSKEPPSTTTTMTKRTMFPSWSWISSNTEITWMPPLHNFESIPPEEGYHRAVFTLTPVIRDIVIGDGKSDKWTDLEKTTRDACPFSQDDRVLKFKTQTLASFHFTIGQIDDVEAVEQERFLHPGYKAFKPPPSEQGRSRKHQPSTYFALWNLDVRPMRNRDGKVVGMIILPNNDEDFPHEWKNVCNNDDEHKYILLSNLYEEENDSYYVSIGIRPLMRYGYCERDICNVMLVRRRRRRDGGGGQEVRELPVDWERVALAQVERRAWEACGPDVESEVRLV